MAKWKAVFIPLSLVVMLVVNSVSADTISFTSADVKNVMAANGAPLHDATNQWGLWAVRAMPIVGGSGLYTITGGSTTLPGWGVNAPNGAFGNSPYTPANNAWFWDASGAEAAGTPANPLYMIMDQPANTFTSYTFNSAGAAIGSVPPGPVVPPQPGGGGTNVVTAVSDASLFSFDFTLGPGATWSGAWQFVVDGSKYTLGTPGSPGGWVDNFFGGYGAGGGLAGNMGAGYPVPEPASLFLLASGVAAGLVALRRRKRT